MQDASARARIRPPMGRATRRSPTEGGNEAALHWRGRGIIINIVVVVIFSAVIAERALASNERAIAAIGPRIQCGTHMRGRSTNTFMCVTSFAICSKAFLLFTHPVVRTGAM